MDPTGPSPAPGSPNPSEDGEAALARAREAEASARERGAPFGIAVARTQAARALMALGRPAEAVTELEEAARFVELMRTEGSHDAQRLLRMTSASAPPPGPDDGDLDTLAGWIGVGRAAALSASGRPDDARQAIAQSRRLARGWRRRSLRRALDTIEASLPPAGTQAGSTGPGSTGPRSPVPGTPASGTPGAPTGGAAVPDAGDLAQRYEQAAALIDAGRVHEGARAALLLVRDADAAGDARLVAAARQALGAALAAGGMGPEGTGEQATAALAGAFDGFAALGDDAAVAAAAPALAQRLVDEGSPARAVDVLERAHAAALRSADDAAQVDLLTALAVARDGAGDTAGALAAAEQAVAQAESLTDPVRQADARHGEAVVRAVHLSGDPAELVEALSLLDAARDAYASHGLPDRAAGCDHEAAALLARAGSYDAARNRYLAARSAYLALPADRRDSGSWPHEVDDCDRSLALIDRVVADAATPVPVGAFPSGGHRMSRGPG